MTAPTVVHCVVRIDNGETVCVRSSNALAWFWIGSKTETYRVEERVAISKTEYDALLRDAERYRKLRPFISSDGDCTDEPMSAKCYEFLTVREEEFHIASCKSGVGFTVEYLIDALPSAAAGVAS